MEENRNVNNASAEGNEDSINFSIHDLIPVSYTHLTLPR